MNKNLINSKIDKLYEEILMVDDIIKNIEDNSKEKIKTFKDLIEYKKEQIKQYKQYKQINR